ncbi:MAG TPA: hemolysin III family protein [Alphaproteobacteria bacterium]|nr:hemolysin III family protein [Alphaproteobacteria bacterium]
MPATYDEPARRYRDAEMGADIVLHLVGPPVGLVAASTLLALAIAAGGSRIVGSVAVYGVGLVAMLGFSAAYHLKRFPARHEVLRRLDHAAIFVMIAGTYTPFTLCLMKGSLALWSTAAMWAMALMGVTVKLAFPRRFELASIAIYLALGWSFVIFMPALLDVLDRPTIFLILAGGVAYSIGACIHRWRRLPFHDAIWHGLVLAGAGLHYAAILHGVVLAGARP